MTMKEVRIAELKARLCEYLRVVRGGGLDSDHNAHGL